MHLRLRLRNTQAVFKTCNSFETMIIARIDLRGEGEWHPELRHFRKSETARHHSNDCPRSATNRDLLPNDVRIATEIFLPEIVSKHHDAIFFGPIFVHRESAPQLRLHTQHFE